MMKLYEIRTYTVDAYYGNPNGYKTVAYTLNLAKAEELRVAEEAKQLTRREWWMDVAKTADNKPRVEVVELGEVVE
jgi:hypothetical protein